MLGRTPSLDDDAIAELTEMYDMFSDGWAGDEPDGKGRERARYYIWSAEADVGPDRLCAARWAVTFRERVHTIRGAMSKDRRQQLLRIAEGFDAADVLWGMGLVTASGEVYRVTVNVPAAWTAGTDAQRREKAGKIAWRPDSLVAAMVWPD